MVAPPAERSISIAADCFVPDWTAATRLPFCLALLGFGRLLDGAADLAGVRFFAVFVIGISFVQLQSAGCTAEAPQKLLGRRGGIPERQMRAGGKHSSAPIGAKCQSFLDNLVAQMARNRARDDPMGMGSRQNESGGEFRSGTRIFFPLRLFIKPDEALAAIMSPGQSHNVCWNGRDHQIVVQK
jgi:hypothetical protein